MALITGGAGFIGTNLAARLIEEGYDVLVYDDLSRAGVERNLQWLCDTYGKRVDVEIADIRNARTLGRTIPRADLVFHLAAQVAVTTSLEDPEMDFGINAHGTLRVLEACRRAPTPPRLLFTSTNKVYGDLHDVELCRREERYEPADQRLREHGVGEDRPLEFHSPYGCSKGVADQYVLDHARCFDLPAVVFRMSCIYGPHQCGTEDQGWVAHFARRMLRGEPITLYGDGCQVRDLLYVEDLVEAMLAAVRRIGRTAGRAFNMGGGPPNAVSLLEVLDRLAEIAGTIPEIHTGPWRQGDQRYYVSDTSSFRQTTGWKPQVGVHEGLERLYTWLAENEPAAAPTTTAALA